MKGPAGVMSLLLAVTLSGVIILLFCLPLWNEVKRGFFRLTGIVAVVLGAGACGSMVAGDASATDAGGLSLRLCVVLTAATLLWLILLFVRRPGMARAIGLASVPLGAALLVALSGTAEGSRWFGLFQLVAGAAFLGAVTDGLLLGHWYLTDRGLTRGPINRLSMILIVATGVQAVAVILGGFQPTAGSSSFNPLLTSAGLASWISLGMVAATGMIAVMIRLTLKGQRASAVQSATGFFYLALLTAFTAELSTLVRFLPA